MANLTKTEREILREAKRIEARDRLSESADAALICRSVDAFARKIGVEVDERCAEAAPGVLEGTWRSNLLKSHKADYLADFGVDWEREKDTQDLVMSWERNLERFLVARHGDIFSAVEVWRGDKNYAEVFVKLK